MLSPAEGATLEAWCDCLIPEDRDAGAKRAGVVRFIDIQLTKRYKKHRAKYAQAIADLNALARKRRGSEFASLPFDERTELLREFEKGATAGAFNMVLDHTMQGYFGSPRHGGNANYASWRMMGVPAAPVRGRLQYSIVPPPAQGGNSNGAA